MQATALWHISPRSSRLEKETLTGEDDRLLVRARYSLISQGTERLVASGRVPPALHEAMRVPYQGGTLALPVKYGYSLVGEVVKGPPGWRGALVHLLHPHQDQALVRPEDCSLLPPGLPPDRAALAANLETALNAVWDGRLSAGDRVLVVGFGLIGALVAHLARAFPATEVWVAEPDEYRREKAFSLGFTAWDPALAPVDVAFNTSASAAGLQQALAAVGREGPVVELSWYGDAEVTLQLGTDFHYQRKRIISSQVSQIPGNRQTRWDHARRKQTVFRLLADPAWDALLDHRVAFAETPALFERLRKNDVRTLSCLVEYE